MKNYFVILTIGSDASLEEVKEAYRCLARERHPDSRAGSDEKLRELQEAYDILRNPVLSIRYRPSSAPYFLLN